MHQNWDSCFRGDGLKAWEEVERDRDLDNVNQIL